MTKEELVKVVKNYRELRAMQAEIKAEQDKNTEMLIQYLKDNNKTSESGDDYTISYSLCKGKVSYNAAKLKALLGDKLSEYQNIGSPYDRISVR